MFHFQYFISMKTLNAKSWYYCLLVAAILVSCNKNDNGSDETAPVLSVPPVEISAVTSFIPFGADLTPTQKNPAFEYFVRDGNEPVRASTAGYVDRVFLNDNFPDYEIWIKLSSGSVYRMIYDHVSNLKVKEGSKILAGDTLGTVGDGRRTELQINKISENKELAYCPFKFGTAVFIQKHKAFSENWCLVDTVVP